MNTVTPLMPALFAVGQHSALAVVRTRLQPNEHLMAFHDYLYVVCRPERVVQVFSILRAELWQHAKIQIHQGKTKVWNRGSAAPENIDVLQQVARMVDPDAYGEATRTFPEKTKESSFSGPPWGTPILCGGICILHRTLLQSAWLIVLFCASHSGELPVEGFAAFRHSRVRHPT